jgi:hypothetical protein
MQQPSASRGLGEQSSFPLSRERSTLGRARSHHIAALLALAAAAQVLPGQAQSSAGPPQEGAVATVYRDTNGMPHILANNEATA